MPATYNFFVKGGLTFEYGFVDTPICCPSRTSTLSGRYGHNLNQTGRGNWCGQFTGYPLENSTWITALHNSGYVTSMSGKYHNAPPQGYVPKGWVRALFTIGCYHLR